MWRERYVKQLLQGSRPMVITSDPDGLLQDRSLEERFMKLGWHIEHYKDPVAFRYLYESQYRDSITTGRGRLILVAVGLQPDELPYDLLRQSDCLEITLENVFPLLSGNVLRHFSTEVLDLLDEKVKTITRPLNEQDTLKWVLRHAYGMVPETVGSQGDLLRELIRLHDKKKPLPEHAVSFLSQAWQEYYWRETPVLRELIKSEKRCYQLLQKEWQRLLKDLESQPEQVLESSASVASLEATHPIMDSGVRVLVDNLFLEGKLKPVAANLAQELPGWMVPGVADESADRKRQRFLEQCYHLSERLTDEINHQQWIDVARWWAALSYQFRQTVPPNDHEMEAVFLQVQQQVDAQFTQWVRDRYQGLSNLPYLPKPVMVHQVPHYLASQGHGQKQALLVLDGMGFQQWLLVEEALKPFLHMEVHGVFAWIPTITSLSRQAIFAGSTPLAFHDTIGQTQAEAKRWKTFWQHHGASDEYVTYIKLSGDPEDKEPLQTLREKHRVVGVVIDWMDSLMHKAMQGNRGYEEELKLWLSTGFLTNLLCQLMDLGYKVAITSDHGSRECKGIGKPQEGIVAFSRGKRMRIYKEMHLRDQAAATYGGIPWHHPALPQNFQVLLAPVEGAFDTAGTRVVSHGGLSLEEVVVPFVQLSPKTAITENNLYEEKR